MNKHSANTLLEINDFYKVNKILINNFKENGYGILFSQFPIKIDIMDIDEKGMPIYKYTYLISNIIPDYQGAYIIEPIGEWENYLEFVTLYDSKDIDFFDENVKQLLRN